MIITLVKADFSKSNIGTLNSWRIQKTLGAGATCSNTATSVDKNAAYNATITIAEGYELGSAGVTVTMGGTALTSGVTVDGNTITIAIASVTGNVKISVPTKNLATGEEGGGNEGSGGNTGETLTLYKSAVGNSILDYQNVWKMFTASALDALGSEIIGVDVASYAGQTITITAAQSVIAGANYAMFCSALPSATINSLTQLQGYDSFGGASGNAIKQEDRSLIIEAFNISTTSETTNSVSKVVPTNAKYLFFANLNAKCANPSVVVGNVAGASLATYTTEIGWCCMDYKEYFYLTGNNTFQGYQSKVIALDVSDLVGETLSITATQSVVDEAYYSFFVNALPSGMSSIEDVNGLTYSADTKYNFDESSLVESFNVSTTNQTVNTITKVVPTGAKYLFVNTLDKFGSSDIKLV